MYPSSLRAWPLLIVLGCHRSYPLDEVPIVGASEEAREIVESELDFFTEAIEPEAIVLSKIAFEEMKGSSEDLRGRYREQARRIEIDETLPVEDISAVLRHELCHALDYQAELASEPREALDAYAKRLYDPNLGGTSWQDNPRTRRSESFARICELGPVVATSLTTPCPDESPLLAELASFAIDEIWRGVPQVPRPLPVEPPVTFAPEQTPFAHFYLKPTNEPDVLQLGIQELAEDPTSTTYTLDLLSGEEVTAGPELLPLDSTVEMEQPVRPLEKVVFFRAAGWTDHGLLGGFFNIQAFGIDTQDYPRERLLWTGEAGWAAVPLCLPGSGISEENDPMRWQIFTADSEVWYAEGDGQSVWWSLVTDQGL